MKRYKVLQKFLTRTKCYIPGDIYEKTGEVGKFTKNLIKYGFIVEMKETNNWEDNAIKSNLANLLIAPVDYVEDEVKYFTWDEACAIEKKLDNGWRLPTRFEWALICEEFGQKDGVLDVETLMNKLGLVKNGVQFPDGEISDAGNEGAYWSSIAYPRTNNAYYLRFYTGAYVYSSGSYNRYNGLSVRLVKDIYND